MSHEHNGRLLRRGCCVPVSSDVRPHDIGSVSINELTNSMTAPKEHIEHHKGGTVRARGQTLDGELTGYWEWFRTDGTKMRSGYFEAGKQVGEWTTYDKAGAVYKVSKMKAKP